MCKEVDYGFNPYMSLWLALKVAYWRVVNGETWRGIAYLFFGYDRNNSDEELKGNQFYGMEIMDVAARKLGFKSYVSWPFNGWLQRG